jgi:hypothetical protein
MTATKPRPYAAGTKVSEVRTREEIDKLLKRWGAEKRAYAQDDDRGIARIEFFLSDRRLRFDVPLPSLSDFTLTESGRARGEVVATQLYEQALRTRWRAFGMVIKAKLEMVATGIESFEESFLSHIVLSDGSTVGEQVISQLEAIYESGVVPDLPGLPPGTGRKLLGPGGGS